MSVVTALSFPRQHMAAEKSGCKSRDAQGCFGNQNEFNRVEPHVLIVSVPSYLTGRRDVLPGKTEKSHGKNYSPKMFTALY